MTYNFWKQLDKGERDEDILDGVFSQGYDITKATDDEQRRGIDRWFTKRDNGRRFKVEYKSDHAGSSTGNAFIETVSVDRDAKPGWAYTSQSDYLFYYLPGMGLLYVLTFSKLRGRLAVWIDKYPARKIPNEGYNTVGVLVPLEELERHALVKVNL